MRCCKRCGPAGRSRHTDRIRTQNFITAQPRKNVGLAKAARAGCLRRNPVRGCFHMAVIVIINVKSSKIHIYQQSGSPSGDQAQLLSASDKNPAAIV